MSLTRLVCNFVHSIMFLYACTCVLYLLRDFVPQHFVIIETLRYTLWDSTLKPCCMAVVQLITDLFQDHYKDFLWVVEALDIKHFVPLSVSTIISPLFTLGRKVYAFLGRLVSQFYWWITLEKFVYIYPVAFWVISFLYAFITRRWRQLDIEEEEDIDDEENDDKSGDEGDDEDDEDDDDQFDFSEDDSVREQQQRMRRMRRNRISQIERFKRRGGPILRINNVGPMHTSRRLDDRLCSICCENERNAVLLPCGHTNLCLQCAYNCYETNKSCPYCQKSVETIHKIFLWRHFKNLINIILSKN